MDTFRVKKFGGVTVSSVSYPQGALFEADQSSAEIASHLSDGYIIFHQDRESDEMPSTLSNLGPKARSEARIALGLEHLIEKAEVFGSEAVPSNSVLTQVPTNVNWLLADKYSGGTASISYAGTDRLDVSYDFPANGNGGEYATLSRNVTAYSSAGDQYLSFEVRLPLVEKTGIQVKLTDSTGQVLTKSVVRLPALSGNSDSDWVPALVNVTRAASFTGGAANGIASAPFSLLQIVVQPKYAYGEAPSGVVSIRNIKFLSNVEALIEALGSAADLLPWVLNQSGAPSAALTYDGTKVAAKVAWTAGAAGKSFSLERGVDKFPWISGLRADVSTSDADTELFVEYTDTRGNVFRQKLKDSNALLGIANDTLRTCYVHFGAGEVVSTCRSGVFSGRVRKIAIIALTTAATGQVFISNVYALDSSLRSIVNLDETAVDGCTQTLELAETVGINYNVGRNFGNHWFEVARSFGGKWIRRELRWSNIEASLGVYNASFYTSELVFLKQLGMKVLYTLNGGNTLHTGSTSALPTTAGHRTAFAAFAAACVQALGVDDVVYEVINEFDLNQYTSDPVPYGQLLDTVIASMKGANPSVKVLNSGTSQHFDAKQDYTRRALAASTRSPDILALHWYNWGASSSAAATGKMENERMVNPEGATAQAIWQREKAAALGIPFSVTEWGYSSHDFGNGDGTTAYGRRQQAVAVIKQVLAAWVAGAAHQIVYTLGDTGSSPTANREHHFGLVDYNNVAKPAYVALTALLNLTSGRKLIGPFKRTLTNPGFSGISLEGMDIVWASAFLPDMTANLVTSKAVKAYNMFGVEIPIARRGKVSSLTLRYLDGPVYLLNE